MRWAPIFYRGSGGSSSIAGDNMGRGLTFSYQYRVQGLGFRKGCQAGALGLGLHCPSAARDQCSVSLWRPLVAPPLPFPRFPLGLREAEGSGGMPQRNLMWQMCRRWSKYPNSSAKDSVEYGAERAHLVMHCEREIKAPLILEVVDHLKHMLPQPAAQLHQISHALRAPSHTRMVAMPFGSAQGERVPSMANMHILVENHRGCGSKRKTGIK